MKKYKRLLEQTLLILCFLVFSDTSSGSLFGLSGTRNVQATLIPEYSQVDPKAPFSLGLYFKIRPGWHIYWKNPGDSGMSTKTNWKLPAHIKLQKTIWPSPIKISLDSIMTYGYEDKVFIFSTFEPLKTKESLPDVQKERLHPKSISMEAGLRWLECKEICLPGKAVLKLTLPTGSGIKNASFGSYLEENQSRYPQEGPELAASAVYKEQKLELTVSGLDAIPMRKKAADVEKTEKQDIYFFIDQPGIIRHTKNQEYHFEENLLRMQLPLDVNHDKKQEKISGYLRLHHGGRLFVHSIEADIEKSYHAFFASFTIILLALLWYFYNRTRSEH